MNRNLNLKPGTIMTKLVLSIIPLLVGGLTVGGEEMWTELPPPWEFEGDLENRTATNARILALRETDKLMSDPQVVEDIEADLQRIYAYDSSLAALAAYENEAPGSFMAELSAEAAARLEEGTYQPWLDLQTELGAGRVRRIFFSGENKWWIFKMNTPYNAGALVAYVRAQWPDIVWISEDFTIDDGSDIERLKDFDWYVFTLAWGDCPSGCENHQRRLVALEGVDREPRELSPDEAKDLLAVRNFVDQTPSSGAVGDRIKLVASASIGLKSAPNTGDAAELNWVVSSGNPLDNNWNRLGQSLLLKEESANLVYGIQITHPATQLSWFVEKAVDLDTGAPAFLRGERYASGWMKHATGWIHHDHAPWIFSRDHGWWWVQESASNRETWGLWDRALGWIWIELSLYPWMYAFGDFNCWLYYHSETTTPRHFYNAQTAQWFTID